MEKVNINLRLADLRKAKHITQRELAEKVGTSFQNISKWENGITMPDITVLPVLASYFEVSVDEILGLRPLKGEFYLIEKTDSDNFWDKHMEYLLRSKNENWNIDYLEFLVKKVWEINKPVKILDCGCGYAYLSHILMPLLPEGSSYTGIDFSSTLTKQAEMLINLFVLNKMITQCNKS